MKGKEKPRQHSPAPEAPIRDDLTRTSLVLIQKPFGNAGRNIVSGPNFFQTDLGLHKSFPVWKERTKLEFRMEAFNLFNHTNFTAPDSNASNIRFDQSGNYTGSFGKITSAFPARQIQFALKLIY